MMLHVQTDLYAHLCLKISGRSCWAAVQRTLPVVVLEIRVNDEVFFLMKGIKHHLLNPYFSAYVRDIVVYAGIDDHMIEPAPTQQQSNPLAVGKSSFLASTS